MHPASHAEDAAARMNTNVAAFKGAGCVAWPIARLRRAITTATQARDEEGQILKPRAPSGVADLSCAFFRKTVAVPSHARS